ncbi:conserved hypothetical protein [Agrobacterium fabacearum CFBP 5771]|uniref:hypothetical protein n=1 Tax=Agrobacterium tumefaciens TaxID=358 RepID=UPI0009D379D1|nr:hypothetical protein [Agrobacterium tumefaciens]CVI22695.1 conserved hypothetical protein [Agrobacterium fabacearum CFBP 5771]
MELFDALPPTVRQAIAGAEFEFVPRFAARLLARGVSAERAAEIIRETDVRLMRKGGTA